MFSVYFINKNPEAEEKRIKIKIKKIPTDVFVGYKIIGFFIGPDSLFLKDDPFEDDLQYPNVISCQAWLGCTEDHPSVNHISYGTQFKKNHPVPIFALKDLKCEEHTIVFLGKYKKKSLMLESNKVYIIL